MLVTKKQKVYFLNWDTCEMEKKKKKSCQIWCMMLQEPQIHFYFKH